MKFHLISDDKDTVTGLRLAGIKGTFAGDTQAAQNALDAAMSDKDNGIILITSGIRKMCPESVENIKLTVTCPLLVEIPDSKGNDFSTDNIMEYVNNAIGVKM